VASTTIRIEWRGDQALQAVQQAASRGVLKACHLLRNEALDLILREQKSGRRYGNHQASAPGEAPASDTGRLVQSIRVEHKGLRGSVIVGADYGAFLERGTSRMRPRPFMVRAMKNSTKKIEAVIAAELRKATR
jgi:HK97 gp10 family phage protein